MLAWLRWIVIAFVLLTIVYVVLGRYFRWDRRKSLEAEATARNEPDIDRASYVAQGMAEYDRSLRKRLVLGVYLVPIAVITALVVIANYN